MLKGDDVIKQLKLKSYGKITIYQGIDGLNENDRWDISSIILPIDIYDDVLIILNTDNTDIKIDFSSDNININMCHEVIKYMLSLASSYHGGVELKIIKKIPVSAGLGGGSSNITAIIKGLNELLHLDLDLSQIIQIAKKFSRDSIYFVYCKPALVLNESDHIILLPSLKNNIYAIIIDPGIIPINEKSKYMFSLLCKPCCEREKLNNIINGWLRNDFDSIISNMYNFIDISYTNKFKKSFLLIKELESLVDSKFVLTGSGPYIVTLTTDVEVSNNIKVICEKFRAKVIVSKVLI